MAGVRESVKDEIVELMIMKPSRVLTAICQGVMVELS
jgi:hypothetical protein